MLTGKWVQFHAQQQRAAQTTGHPQRTMKQDYETRMGVDTGYDTGDGQGGAEELKLLWGRDLSHQG